MGVILAMDVSSQCNEPLPDPSDFCSTAPVICSLDCLDGFTGTLPDTFYMPQPDPLCGGDGQPNNPSWFAFVAGSKTIDISIIPSGCNMIFKDGQPETIGIQAGIYSDCSWDNSSIVCATDGCQDLIAETLNLVSSDFVIGETYYLFVDGCGGSICDYEVVVNAGMQAFEMPEITSISNNFNLDLPSDTICRGANIQFVVDGFEDVVGQFYWSISPPTSDYPDGMIGEPDTNVINITFSDQGSYTLYVYASNGCDASETDSILVEVAPIEDEIFSPITVCQECFPLQLSMPDGGCINVGGALTILTEDPNGDGVIGWQGNDMTMGPGKDTAVIQNIFGCTFLQIVDVIEIPISPRLDLDYYYCIADFPVTINGETYNVDQKRFITLEGAAASGCDSLVSISAHALDLFGMPKIGDCQSGDISIYFDIISVSPANYDSITYVWYDGGGMEVTDGDGIDSILVVSGQMSYTVSVTVWRDSVDCEFAFGPFYIDPDNLLPNIPNVTYAPVDICTSEETALIYVANQGLGEDYTWTLTPPLSFVQGTTSDTIHVDISGGQNFEVCVSAGNGCGVSMDTCFEVNVISNPSGDFTIPQTVCKDSTVTISYEGGVLPGYDFYWFLETGILQNINADGDEFDVIFPDTGYLDIGLVIDYLGCISDTVTHQIYVQGPIKPPEVSCHSGQGEVYFTWDNDEGYTVSVAGLLTGQSDYILVGDSLYFGGLPEKDTVHVILVFEEGDACGGATVDVMCIAGGCPDIDLEITLDTDEVCIGDELDISVDVIVSGDDAGTGQWSTTDVHDGIFDYHAAGVGSHLLSYQYTLGTCMYSIDTFVVVHGRVEYALSVISSPCPDDVMSYITIETDSTNTVFIDGTEVNFEDLDSLPLLPGMYAFEILGQDGCVVGDSFDIPQAVAPQIEISGSQEVIEGDREQYELIITPSINNAMISWTYQGDTLCTACPSVEFDVQDQGELCAIVSYGVGGSCVSMECAELRTIQKSQLYFPDIFSPNGDGVNDHFNFYSNKKDLIIESLSIFDRWGNKLYQMKNLVMNDKLDVWDGTYQGKICDPGVYVFIVRYRDDGEIKQKVGDVTLVR